jgi:hypothetical protein
MEENCSPGQVKKILRNGAMIEPTRPIIDVMLTPIERTSVGNNSAESVNRAQKTADIANFPTNAAMLVDNAGVVITHICVKHARPDMMDRTFRI